MQRRRFIQSIGAMSAGVFIGGCNISGSPKAAEKEMSLLAEHTIEKIEFDDAKFHYPRKVGKNARIGVHGQHHSSYYVKLTTDQGAAGWGPAYIRREDAEQMSAMLKGKRVSEIFDPGKGIFDGVNSRCFDIALHDLGGVILDKPVYKMLGAKGETETKVYSGMIYLDELAYDGHAGGIDVVMDNCRWDVNYGYRQLKVKIGRSGRWYQHDEGLAMDIKIVKMIHEEFGDKVEVLVDSNDMYSLQDTIDFLKGVSEVPIWWVEEPFMENVSEGRKLKEWMLANGRENTRYADGEYDPKVDVCMMLAKEKVLDVFLPDIVDWGFTKWRRAMSKLIAMGCSASPHAWGHKLKTHYGSHLAAGLGNVCTVEGVTCISDDIDYGDYPIVNGKIRVSDKPGFGMKIIS